MGFTELTVEFLKFLNWSYLYILLSFLQKTFTILISANFFFFVSRERKHAFFSMPFGHIVPMDVAGKPALLVSQP